MGILSAGIGAVAAERIAVGARSAERLLTETMSSSRGHVVQELHTLVSQPGERALLDTARAGSSVDLILHPRIRLGAGFEGAALADAARSGSLASRTYEGATGMASTYPHSKLLAASASVDHAEPVAAFTNVSLAPTSAARQDVTIRFGGDAARATRDVLDATIAGDLPRMTSAIDDARRAGVLINDASVGRNHLGRAMYDMVDNARERLVIVSKGLDDETFARHVVAARQRGVDVSLSLRDIAKPSADILHEGGVRTMLHPTGGEQARINVMIADDTALASTSYQWRNMLGDPATGAGITSRESGVVLRGADRAELERQLAMTEAGGMALPPTSLDASLLPADAAARGGVLAHDNAWDALRELRGSKGLSGFTSLDRSLGTRRIVSHLD